MSKKDCQWKTIAAGHKVLLKKDGTICGGDVPRSWQGKRLQDEPWKDKKGGYTVTKKEEKQIKQAFKYAKVAGFNLTEKDIRDRFLLMVERQGVDKARIALDNTVKDFRQKANTSKKRVLNEFKYWYMKNYGSVPTRITKKSFTNGDINIEKAKKYPKYEHVAIALDL